MNKQFYFLSKSILFFAILLTTGQVQAQNMALDWVKNIPRGNGFAQASVADMATDNSGNTYLTGTFMGDTLDFDPGPGVFNLVSNGIVDIFILKLDASGNLLWAKQMGTAAPGWAYTVEWGATIAVDPHGNVLIGGVFMDTADFDPGLGFAHLISNGYEDGFILKLDSLGNYIWAVSMGSVASSEGINRLITDEDGNIYATGTFQGTVDFDPGPGTTMLTAAGSDIFVLKLDAAGKLGWVSQLFLSIGGNSTGLVRDTKGNINVSGWLNVEAPPGATWWGAGPTVGVWRLDSLGNMLWAYHCDDHEPPNDKSGGITCDATGNIYVAGFFMNTIDFDAGPGRDTLMVDVDSLFRTDMFILKLDTAGNVLWVSALRTGGNYNGPAEAPSIIIDVAHNLVVAANFIGTVDVDPGPGTAYLTSYNGSADFFLESNDFFLLKMDTASNYLWAKSIGSKGFDNPAAIISDAHGNLWCTGNFEDTVDFDPQSTVVNLTPSGQFIMKLICNDTSVMTIKDTACGSYILNGETYTTTGTYTQIRPNTMGCDSIITLQLTIPVLDPVIRVNGFVLSTTGIYTTYQWFLNGTLINSATKATYTVTQNGDYTVVVTNNNGCTDTSDIYKITNVTGIEEDTAWAGAISIYPNPAADLIYVKASMEIDITLSSIEGKMIKEGKSASSVSVKDLAAGVYLLRVSDKEGHLIKVEKVIKK